MTVARPHFSVLLARTADATHRDDVSATVATLQAQTLDDWELLILSPAGGVPLSPDVADPRIRLLDPASGADPVAARNRALDLALGELLIVLEPGDTLAAAALARLSRAAKSHARTDCVYADEDIPGADGGREVIRKPAWSPERLRHSDYIGRPCALRTSAVREVGGYRVGYGPVLDYDLLLRVCERSGHVEHVPVVLAHRAARPDALAGEEAARRAVHDQLSRVGVAATVVPGHAPGYRRLARTLRPDVAVSIIMPTRGQAGTAWGQPRSFVVEAVRSALANTAHPNVEMIVVYDEETPQEALEQLRNIAGDRLTCLPFREPFSFSAKCNLGFLQASGDVIVLLNDDTQAISKCWLETLVAPLAEPDVGMTGAKLLYPDGTIQHGGHLYASGNVSPYPLHAYRWHADTPGELGGLAVNRECSGVTAACAALRRDVYERVGGLTELLPINYNDVDLSLKIRHAGLRIVWIAECELYHFESQTRTPKIRPAEVEFLRRRWGDSFARDPYLPWLDYAAGRKRPAADAARAGAAQ